MNIPNVTLAGFVWPETASMSWLRGLALALLGSLLVAICAQINVPLPFVPITMQTFAVLTVGAALGWRLGALSLLFYIAEGAAGLPVFAEFKAGPAVILGPTGGYIVGFVIAAAVTGWFAQKGFDRNAFKMFLAMLVGSALIYIPGVLWLTQFTGADKALELGLYPFIWGDVLKAALAAMLFPAAWLLLDRR
jgi:biotin transport system substrate-specific component